MTRPEVPVQSWPLEAPASGQALFATGHDSIREVLWNLLATRPGERLMRPQFGIGLHAFVHQPNNETTRRLMEKAITRGIQRWETRIDLLEVRVLPAPQYRDEVSIYIHYQLKQDTSVDTYQLNLPLRG